MTLTLYQGANQRAAGAPVSVRSGWNSTDPIGDTFPFLRLATTTTSTPPATFSACAHTDVASYENAIWDSAHDSYVNDKGGGVQISGLETYVLTKLLRLDANYAAGRYLWFTGWTSATPSAGDAPSHLAGPYLIT